MDNRKAMWALAALPPALLVGAYLSGYMTLLLLKLDPGLLEWDTYLRYLQALDLPQVARHAPRIRLGGMLGFGASILPWLVATVLVSKPREKTLHGDARFATRADLAAHGMFEPGPDGIVVGRHGRKLIRLRGQQFVVLAAPTRSGKGVGVVIPNLLDYQESAVVLDIKQENFALTSGWRQSQGQDVYLFNPFAEDGRTHRWNPLSYVSRNPALRISDLQGIAAMLYPDGAGDQRFWISQARNAFTAFALYLFENFDDQRRQRYPADSLLFPTLGAIYRLSSGDGGDLKRFFGQLSQRPFLGNDARTAFANLLSQADETFASILGTFREPLHAFINPILDAATSDNDFLLTDVRRKKMTIYLGIQPNKLAESRVIANLFFSQLINANTRELPQDNPALKHQCLLLMDEFTAIGRIDILANAVAFMAGYNLRLLPIIQSMSQLDAVYGKDVARTLITNHALQILYAPREQQDANDYSEMLGYTTVRKHNVTRGRDYSRSESEERRALMLPQELKAMGGDREVFLYEGIPHPVLCQKVRYYEDKYFTRRLLPRVEVSQLKIGGAEMPNKTVQAVSAAASLALAACAGQSVATTSATETVAGAAAGVTEPRPETIHPKLSAEQALFRLLELIRSSRSIADFTPELLNSVTGLEVSFEGADRYAVGENVTAQWSYRFYVNRASMGEPRFEFSFNAPPSSTPESTEICRLDFNRFSTELEAMGFYRDPVYGELRRIEYYQFADFRPEGRKLGITIYARGEANEPVDRIRHDCIWMVVIK